MKEVICYDLYHLSVTVNLAMEYCHVIFVSINIDS